MTMLPLRDLSDMPLQAGSFPPFEIWSRSPLAQSALASIYRVMSTAAPLYPTEPWLQQPANHHARKAHLHTMLAFEDIYSVDKGGRGGTPSTGCFNWEHALTRLAMVSHQFVNPKSQSENAAVIVVDSRPEEVKAE